jgi:alkylhydroperoxidase/carboxymuconolactone decarboxylase family protein YurZ
MVVDRTASGVQTAPRLGTPVAGAATAGATARGIVEVILQRGLHGGLPAAINARATATDVFETGDARPREAEART